MNGLSCTLTAVHAGIYVPDPPDNGEKLRPGYAVGVSLTDLNHLHPACGTYGRIAVIMDDDDRSVSRNPEHAVAFVFLSLPASIIAYYMDNFRHQKKISAVSVKNCSR